MLPSAVSAAPRANRGSTVNPSRCSAASSLGCAEQLQCQLWCVAINLKYRVGNQSIDQSKWMGDALSQCQTFIAECQTSFGIPKQPIDPAADLAGADAWIMPAIEQAVRTMPFRIIDAAPRFRVLACTSQLSRKDTSRPGTVVRLKSRFVVCLDGSQFLKPVRQCAALVDLAGAVCRLPETINRHEPLAWVATLVGKLAGASVRISRHGGAVTSCSKQREAAGQLQLDLSSVASWSVRQ